MGAVVGPEGGAVAAAGRSGASKPSKPEPTPMVGEDGWYEVEPAWRAGTRRPSCGRRRRGLKEEDVAEAGGGRGLCGPGPGQSGQ